MKNAKSKIGPGSYNLNNSIMKNSSKCKVKIFPLLGVDGRLMNQYIMVDPNLIQFRPKTSNSLNKKRSKSYAKPNSFNKNMIELRFSTENSATRLQLSNVLSSHRLREDILQSTICSKLEKSSSNFIRKFINDKRNSSKYRFRNNRTFSIKKVKPRYITLQEAKCSILETELKKILN